MSYNDKTNKYEGYIYLITNLVTGYKYVGQTRITVESRWKDHISKARSKNGKYTKQKIDKAIREYGESNFSVEEIDSVACDTIEQCKLLLNEKEIYWISFYNTYESDENYNDTPGGSYAHIITEKTVLIYTINGDYVVKIKGFNNAGNYLGVSGGSIWQACQYPSEYKLCKNHIIRYEDNPLTEEDLYNIRYKKYPQFYQYDFNGNLLNIFDNHLQDALSYMESIGKPCTRENILHATADYGYSSKGFIWRKFPDKFEDKPLPPKVKQRPVEKRDPYNAELLKTYVDLNNASKEERIPHKTLCGCCMRVNGQMITHNYYWCYEGDFDLELFNNYKNNNHMMKKYRVSDDQLSPSADRTRNTAE